MNMAIVAFKTDMDGWDKCVCPQQITSLNSMCYIGDSIHEGSAWLLELRLIYTLAVGHRANRVDNLRFHHPMQYPNLESYSYFAKILNLQLDRHMQTHFTHTTVCDYKRLGSPLCYCIDGHIQTHML